MSEPEPKACPYCGELAAVRAELEALQKSTQAAAAKYLNECTPRMQIASMAIQGMLAYSMNDVGNWNNNASPTAVAQRAVEYADALIKELSQRP
jgi:hypothetical protein